MKKALFLIASVLLGTVLYAGPVSRERALQVAEKVFGTSSATKSAAPGLKIVWDGEFEQTKAAVDPALYVVTRDGGGFLIVAGNDNVQPVLGLSFENDFKVEGMPENVRWWMEQYKRYVRSAVSATPEINDQWAQFAQTKALADPVTPGTPGLTDEFTNSRTNEWDQKNPANFYCPKVEDQEYTSVCGCVALATAEVMVWFGNGNLAEVSGTIPGYNYTSSNSKSVDVPGRILDHFVYDWAGMKALTTPESFYNQISSWTGAPTINDNKYYGGSTEGTSLTALGENLAHLLFDIGSLVQAEYNYNPGTGAYSGDIVNNVGPFMGYNNTARYVSKDEYTNGQWAKMVKDEITLRPVIYTGSGTPGGHAYVADGFANYGGNQLFHFNLGWGGSCNGYYTLDIQDDFDGGHYAIFDFYPNPSASTPLPAIGYAAYNDPNPPYNLCYGGVQYVDGYNSSTLAFNLKGFFNVGAAPFLGSIYAVRKNAVGAVAKETKSLWDDEDLGVGAGYAECGPIYVGATTPALVLGDYVEMYYKENGKDAYLPFVTTPFNPLPTTIPFFPAAAIKKNASYSVNDYFVFELTNSSYLLEKTDDWGVTTPGGTTTHYTTDDYQVQLTESGEYKITCTTAQETLVTFITVL